MLCLVLKEVGLWCKCCVCAAGCIVLSVKGLCTMAQWSGEQFTAPHLPKNDILHCVIGTTETKQDTNKFCSRSFQMEGLQTVPLSRPWGLRVYQRDKRLEWEEMPKDPPSGVCLKVQDAGGRRH